MSLEVYFANGVRLVVNDSFQKDYHRRLQKEGVKVEKPFPIEVMPLRCLTLPGSKHTLCFFSEEGSPVSKNLLIYNKFWGNDDVIWIFEPLSLTVRSFYYPYNPEDSFKVLLGFHKLATPEVLLKLVSCF